MKTYPCRRARVQRYAALLELGPVLDVYHGMLVCAGEGGVQAMRRGVVWYASEAGRHTSRGLRLCFLSCS